MWWWIVSFGETYNGDVLQHAKQLISLRLPQMTKYCIMRECPTQIFGSRLQIVAHRTLNQGKHGPPSVRPNYISQDDNKEQQHGYNTRSQTTSVMQEAMMACIDITKPTFKLSAQKMVSRRFPIIWLCEMVNSVLGEQGELLEYRQLITNPKTRGNLDPFIWE
jgi:hypothetical protein